MTPLITNILSLLTILGNIIIGFAILGIVLERFFKVKFPIWLQVKKEFSKYGLVFALIVSLIATLGSLYYSEIAKFEPCKLCWYQRIFMYPQVILLWLALMRGFKKEIKIYSIALSAVGLAIALNHYYLQRTGISFIPCSAVGYSVSCSQSFVLNYGYITIPMMAATAFSLMIVFIYYFDKKINK